MKLALLAVLMYFPDQYARGLAQDAIIAIEAGKDPDGVALRRIARLIEVKASMAQHSDVWRSKERIEKHLKEGRAK